MREERGKRNGREGEIASYTRQKKGKKNNLLLYSNFCQSCMIKLNHADGEY